MKNEPIMKRWPLPALAVTLLLCLLSGGVLAAPGLHPGFNGPLLWQGGAKPVAHLNDPDMQENVCISWPSVKVIGAVHYRLRIERNKDNAVVYDESPMSPDSVANSTVTVNVELGKGNYTIIVTAYVTQNGKTFSRSIQTTFKVTTN
jgi:hypothetical protein